MSKELHDQTVIQENPSPATQPPVALQTEELESVIAPKVAFNHNETVLATRLDAEELEPVIAPRLSANHNENVLATRLEAEELEAVIAPRLSANHNETVLE